MTDDEKHDLEVCLTTLEVYGYLRSYVAESGRRLYEPTSGFLRFVSNWYPI